MAAPARPGAGPSGRSGLDSPKAGEGRATSPRPARAPVPTSSKGGSPSGGSSAGAPRSTDRAKARKLLDEYEVGNTLGEGAFGVVRTCLHKTTRKEFAVKMVDKVETPAPTIMREAEMLQSLTHPNVVKFHDVFNERCFVCIVMDIYKGGDLVDGLQRQGPFECDKILHVSHQIAAGIHYLHDHVVAHRDIKGDNFMMDLPEVENLSNRIYLSDFGTVQEVKPGERITQKCGTKNYWSPEFYKQNYSLKVDCWAIGVIMFGFFSGKFPFKNEEEVKHKKLSIHPRAGADGEQLIKMAFERSEQKRVEAKDAMQHPFLAEVGRNVSTTNLDFEEGFKPEMLERGANAGVKERRRELVERLVKKANEPITADEPGGLEVKQLSEFRFQVTDKVGDRALTLQWTDAAGAKECLVGHDAGTPLKQGSMHAEVDKGSIRKLLKQHNVSIANFGKDKAKTFDEFVEEIQQGSSRLLIDATKYKHLVRVVDVVILRIQVNTPTGSKFLVETSERYPDGRIRNTNRFPGSHKAPHENVTQAASRLVKDMLDMQDCKIAFDFPNIDTQEQGEESPSYPGVQTVYMKETITGLVTITDQKVLKRLGLEPGTEGSDQFQVEDKKQYLRKYVWQTEEACQENIDLVLGSSDEDISALVYPPIGLEEEDLADFLVQNNVDISQWGSGTYKSLEDLSEELVKGASTLVKQSTGKISRVVDIVVLKFLRDDGRVLIECEEAAGSDKTKLNRLPAMKRRADEHPFSAAHRLVVKYLQFDDNHVNVDPTDVRMVEEKQESTSFPGLSTVYRKRFMTANMVALGATTPFARRSG